MDELIEFLRDRANEMGGRYAEGVLRIANEFEEALRLQGGFRETGWEEGRREALELACRALSAAHADHEKYRDGWKL